MGCDIHTNLEVKKTINGQKKWFCADSFTLNPYFDGDKDKLKYEKQEVFSDRNYTAFTQLAGVRDYTNSFKPISEMRGIPEDSCPETKEDYLGWEGDAHNAGWVTLKEVIEFRKNLKPTKFSGLVDEEGFKNIQEGKPPEWWCQGSSYPLIYAEWYNLVDPLEELEKELREIARREFYCYNEERVLEQSENVRFVFWFDN